MNSRLLRYCQPVKLGIALITFLVLPAGAARALSAQSDAAMPIAQAPLSETLSSASTANFVPQTVLEAVNQLSTTLTPTLPGLGQPEKFLPVVIKTRLVLKLSERRVYVYQQNQLETSFPVAIGRAGWETPTGTYHVIQMQQNPVWQHPFTGELVPPGTDNPLGARWIGFWTDGTNFIGFHGTPNEDSVGRPASHGCVRMYNRDVTKLFDMVQIGTPVEVVP